MSTKEFYHSINQSNDQLLQFKRWDNYREKINLKLESYIKDQRIIILGAGNCNDLDLNSLTYLAKNITLADIDTDSIEKGIIRQDLKENNFEIKEVDFTGLNDNFYKNFKNLVRNNQNPEEIYKQLKATVSKITTENIIDNQYDVVISTPVYSQLVYANLFKIIKESNYNQKDNLRRKILDLMPSIINIYNDLILSITRSQGVIIIWSDVMEFKTSENIDVNKLAKIYANYIKRYGLGIPGFGLIDLGQKIEISEEFWDIWPFNYQKKYIIKGMIGLKNKE